MQPLTDTPTTEISTTPLSTTEISATEFSATEISTVATTRPTEVATGAVRTGDDVVGLFRRVHRDGPDLHAEALGELADAARRLGADPPLVALVTDRAAPDEIRVRAVARLARQWPALTAAATVADPWFERTLAALLARWNAHHDLRAAGAGVAALADSRRAVDAARRDHITARRPLRPTG